MRAIELSSLKGGKAENLESVIRVRTRFVISGWTSSKVPSEQPVCVFVAAALPRALWITEVDFHIRGHREGLVLGHLQPAVPGQRSPQVCWELPNVPGGHHSGSVFAGHLDERGKTRMTFHQVGDVTVLGAAQQITLPMAGDGAVLDEIASTI